MTIQEQIKGDLKDAMRAKDRTRVTTLRGMLAAFINELTAQGKKPDAEAGDELALTALKRAIKQRREAIEQYEKGGRAELAKEEKKELEILETYLPEQMSEEEIHKIAEAKKEELGITDMSDMGRLIGAVVKETNGQADGAVVKNIVSKLLS